jgi:starch synthase (maltosyl-transferring)
MSRIVIRNVAPEIDGGRFAIKRTLGERISVNADVFSDSHSAICATLKYRHHETSEWTETPMVELAADKWTGTFLPEKLGLWWYTIEAKKTASGKLDATTYESNLKVIVDPVIARFGAWYQVFPRSCSYRSGKHGTLQDLTRRLPEIAAMGFDVVCIPPIHPIGITNRKGKNGSLTAHPDDPGSPWAVGSPDGGHKAIHPELGTLDDFRRLASSARDLGLRIALDIALQCSPDHPYVREHPEWFLRKPDGSFQCSEDPPNRYDDVYAFDFDCFAREALWDELRSIFAFWIDEGIRVFRIDNPHTKPFDFWEWLLGELREKWTDLVFISEGLTRPELMHHLARVGFNLSYDYFGWYNTKNELATYYQLLTKGNTPNYFRPCLWPTTPQYLPPFLRNSGRSGFLIRLTLAATLGASYGLYGPAFELCENQAVPGTSDYEGSEQFELKLWDWNCPINIRDSIKMLNRIRKSELALQYNAGLHFHGIENDQLILYSKADVTGRKKLLIAVNLNPHYAESGWTQLDLDILGLSQERPYGIHDLLTGAKYEWRGIRNYIRLDPAISPAHIFKLEDLD